MTDCRRCSQQIEQPARGQRYCSDTCRIVTQAEVQQQREREERARFMEQFGMPADEVRRLVEQIGGE